jgi:hypothetical protein
MEDEKRLCSAECEHVHTYRLGCILFLHYGQTR